MSNKLSKVEPAKAAATFNELLVTGTSSLSFEEAFEVLDRADDRQLTDLSAEYFKFTEEMKGVAQSFVVEGMATVTLEGKEVQVVKLRNKEGKTFINGDTVLVSACSRLNTLPAYIRVTLLGVKKSNGSNKSYNDLSIKTFPIN